jgi:8-oxo-dGTP pyrophosphatase MutT (NUDIX family)
MKQSETSFQIFIHKLKNGLEQPLPGLEAQIQMLPEGRLPAEPALEYINAATLICIYPEKDAIYFPLIRRANHPHDRHSQQLSLPGGRSENGEKLVETALREAYEEVGIPPESVNILGALTPLPIPVSGYLMHPFVGYCKKIPHFKTDPAEVQTLHLVNVEDIFNKDKRRMKSWILGGIKRQVPVYQIDTLRIWGATAMVLSEFAAILKSE